MRSIVLFVALAALVSITGCVVPTSYHKELITELDGDGKILRQTYKESITQRVQDSELTFKYLRSND